MSISTRFQDPWHDLGPYWPDSLDRTDQETWKFLQSQAIFVAWTKDPQSEIIEHSEPMENSTTYQESLEEVKYLLDALFRASKEEVFEDGMESYFSRGLVAVIEKYGNDAIKALVSPLIDEAVAAETASEALRWLGHMDHPPTYRLRLLLLKACLKSRLARVRDGAALGLSFLDDPDAIPELKDAVQAEPIKELRKNIEQVVDQLEKTSRCRFSSERYVRGDG